MSNSIFIIQPRNRNGTWVFTDEARDLRDEPFVGQANDVIDMMTIAEQIPNAEDGFNLVFSANPFPDATRRFDLVYTTALGSIYAYEGVEVWLCPALFCYFPKAPPTLYVAALPFRKQEVAV